MYPKMGDHVSIKRGLIRHHMLVVKPEQICEGCFTLTVIHITKKLTGGCVTEEKLKDIIEEDGLLVHSYGTRYSAEQAITRARALITLKSGSDLYNLLTYNCEHFVRWAKTGRKDCRQLKQVGVAAAGGVGGMAAGGGIGTYMKPQTLLTY